MNNVLIAYQFGADLAASVLDKAGHGVEMLPLPDDDPWAIPPGVEVLLTDPASVGNLSPDTARPAHWPASLRWAHLRSTGVDRLPSWFYDVPLLTVSRGGQAAAISEFVIAAMLSAVKRMPEIWVSAADQWRKTPLGSLDGDVLGLAGFGQIGQAVARRAAAFSMQIMAARRSGRAGGIPGVTIAPLETVLAAADHVVVCAPLTPETRGLIGSDAFSRMKEGAHLINVGRGAVVDTAALGQALDSGQLGLATLDVVDPEPPPAGHWLYSHPRVRLSPHVSYSAPGTEHAVNRILHHNVAAYLAGRFDEMHGVVDRAAGY